MYDKYKTGIAVCDKLNCEIMHIAMKENCIGEFRGSMNAPNAGENIFTLKKESKEMLFEMSLSFNLMLFTINRANYGARLQFPNATQTLTSLGQIYQLMGTITPEMEPECLMYHTDGIRAGMNGIAMKKCDPRV
ncbi:unnamed protein product [Brugia pahangi]|uniref:Uncharacterized protein n=1 Tax=Brugia pahangi TaxID=6280 RepID=A0A0N4TNR8_BRUPA|nr:unnamed protein product [Brugia pahangi]